MKKILLPIFGGVLLTGSISLTTGQNVDTVIKQKEQQEMKEQEIFNSWYSINSESALTEEKIKEVQVASQSWNNEVIDSVLNQALQYDDNQLTINWNKLNVAKLPSQILENINLSLANLNNAVTLGHIKVTVTSNNTVQLIYSNNNNTLSNNDVVYFDNKLLSSTYGSDMWYSTYGPSAWWKFWEWGGYIHFSEQAVQNVKPLNILVSLMNIYFLFKNIREILNIIDELNSAVNAGNVGKTNELLAKLAKVLGGVDLELLGNIIDILGIFTAIGAFILTLLSGTGFIAAIIELIIGIIASVTGRMVSADRGNGVKWQWLNFVIPGGISAE